MEKVTVMLTGPSDTPVWVQVNGMPLAVPKNVPVEIPLEYYEALRVSSKQRGIAIKLQQMLEESTDTKMSGTGQTLSGFRLPEVKLPKGAPLVVD